MELSRSFRLRSFSRRPGRSNSCLLESELAWSADLGTVAGYQRLSESMRLTGEREVFEYDRRVDSRARVVGFLGRVFSFRRDGDKTTAETIKMKEKKKRRSSWLPDPDRRWPIQGW